VTLADSIVRLKYDSDSDKAYADNLIQEIKTYSDAFQSRDKFRIGDARSKAGKNSGVAEMVFEKKDIKCVDGVCGQPGEKPSFTPENPLGRKLFSIDDGNEDIHAKNGLEESVLDADKSEVHIPLDQQQANTPPEHYTFSADKQKDTQYQSLPSPQTSASERLEPPAILSLLALPFFVLFRGGKYASHPDKLLREQAEQFAHKFTGTVPPVLSTSIEPDHQAPEQLKPEEKTSEPKVPLGNVTTNTNELPCLYSDGSNNVKTTEGKQPEGALMGPCRLPKAPKPPIFTAATAQSISGSLVDGATTGFTYGFLSQLFQNQGMEQSLAQLAAEGAVAANIAQTSGYIPAAAYVALSHLPMKTILDGLGDLANYVPQGVSRAISSTGKPLLDWSLGLVSNLAGWKFGGWGGNKVAMMLNGERTKAIEYLRSLHPEKKHISLKDLLSIPEHLLKCENAASELDVARFELQRAKIFHAVYIVNDDTERASHAQAKIESLEGIVASLEKLQPKACDIQSITLTR
jgi:hypothetical protein